MTPHTLALLHAVMRMSVRQQEAITAHDTATDPDTQAKTLRAVRRRYKATLRLGHALANAQAGAA
ncbi:hypothetical protein [Micromonospora sp. NPDC049891]|uniref:hypothetical protein n=1 Tax=Micromonospora sp. NPDC049891 TaxID=3155655 RepID=UPI0033E84A4C